MKSPSLPVRVSRNGGTELSDLELIRKQLRGNNLAINYIGRFLNYGNALLTAAEKLRRTPYDQARAEVTYANHTFIFSRL